jgi:hypothetical protein
VGTHGAALDEDETKVLEETVDSDAELLAVLETTGVEEDETRLDVDEDEVDTDADDTKPVEVDVCELDCVDGFEEEEGGDASLHFPNPAWQPLPQ